MPISYPYGFSCWYGYDKDCANFTSSMTVGSWTFLSQPHYGYDSGNAGFMSNTSFNNGTINALLWRNFGGGEIYFWISNQASFSSITINGTTFPGSSSWTQSSGIWFYSTSINPFGTSGNITITANY